MAVFVVLLGDKQRGGLTEALLHGHIEHLRCLSRDERLLLCGPFGDDDGALQILRADTPEEAHALVRADPLIADRYYRSYRLRELIEANEANAWLTADPQTVGNRRGCP